MNYSPDMTTAAVKMMLSLGLVLAIVWGLYRVAKKRLPMVNGGGKGRLIQVVENHCLGVKKHITLVKVPGTVLVLGLGGDKVSLLARIDDPAVLQHIDNARPVTKPVLNFKAQLHRFTHGTDSETQIVHKKTVVE